VDPLVGRLVVLLALVGVCAAVAVVRRRRSGVARAVTGAPPLTAADLGHQLGAGATLVQFSTTVCTPCRAARKALATYADAADGVTHVEVDAEQRQDLARRYGVLRAPTVLVVDGSGDVVRRLTGVPTPEQIRAALTGLAPEPSAGGI
jgi:thiol-disulfide isomerase/thioredoxin